MGLPRSPVITLLLLLIILLVSPVGAAVADGKVFAREGVVATIPDQRALIAYENGIQTLVIETRFEASGSPAIIQESTGEAPREASKEASARGEFAWVVPVPSVPELFEVTPGLMPTVQAVFEPRVVEWGGGPLAGVAAISLFVACFILLCMKSWAKGLLALLFLLCGGVILLPALAKSRGLSGAESTGVTLHERRLIGHLDVAVLSAETSELLVSWLTSNGFAVPPETAPAIERYVRDGWSFCAARLDPDVSTGIDAADASTSSSPQPLGMRFTASAPIYPLRLTATATESLVVDLYVCGPGRAASDVFKAVRCGLLVAESQPASISWGDEGSTDGFLHISHAGLRAIVGDARVGTKLSATLTPRQMEKDAVISWESYAPKGEVVHGRRGAFDRALLYGAGVLAFGSLASLVIAAFARLDHAASSKLIGGVLVIAVLVGFAVRLMLPGVPTTVRDRRPLAWTHQLIQNELMDACHKKQVANATIGTVPSIDELRAMLGEICRQFAAEYELAAPREEDSPGNYTLRETAEGIEYVWYDRKGAERSELVVFALVEPEPDPARTPDPSGP